MEVTAPGVKDDLVPIGEAPGGLSAGEGEAFRGRGLGALLGAAVVAVALRSSREGTILRRTTKGKVVCSFIGREKRTHCDMFPACCMPVVSASYMVFLARGAFFFFLFTRLVFCVCFLYVRRECNAETIGG